jgi:flavin reductase (DIM6/NTAB) family NADH-FMN oxidoreductase RutF
MGTNIDPQVDAKRFREVLGHLPTGVTVVTAHHS